MKNNRLLTQAELLSTIRRPIMPSRIEGDKRKERSKRACRSKNFDW